MQFIRKHLRYIILSFLVLIILGISYLFFDPVPMMAGEINLPKLSQSVKVLRDKYGIPHIYANNELDAYRVLGYVMASERLFQMDINRRLGNGELSEIFGESLLPIDKLFRTYQFKQSMVEVINNKKRKGKFDKKIEDGILAFYDGVNEFINTQTLPREFKILGYKPRPFVFEDALGFTGYMAYSFAISMKLDFAMSKAAKEVSPQMLEELRNEIEGTKGNHSELNTKVLKGQQSLLETVSLLDSVLPVFSMFDGSNAWLIGKEKSVTGSPIFANDPHISFSLPGIWFEAQIITPDHQIYGHYLPLLPFAVLGERPDYVWGLTMSEYDDMDFYQEKLSEDGKKFLFKNQWYDIQETTEVIKIKSMPDVSMSIKKTIHGPLLDEVSDEKSIAVKWSFHDPQNDPVSAFYGMGHAKNIDEFKKSFSEVSAPGLNIMYADKENIGWWIMGDQVIRPKHVRPDFILDGSTGLDEWMGKVNFDKKPSMFNPPSGFIVSANSHSPGLSSEIVGVFQAPDRYETISALLNQKVKWTVEDVKNLQTKNINLENKKLLDVLLNLNSFKNLKDKFEIRAIDILKEWSLESHIDQVAPTIYYTWQQEIIKKLLSSKLSEESYKMYSSTLSWYVFYKRVMYNPYSDWWKPSSQDEIAYEAFKVTLAKLKVQLGENINKWNWGRVHMLEYVHPIGRKSPLNFVFNLGPWPIPGAFNEINNNKQLGLNDFKVLAGPSTRRISDLSNRRYSYGILPLGISGRPRSPYYKDQSQMFLKGEYREQLIESALVQKNATSELIFNPLPQH